jgi:membrane protease YdiL (CAAX protease family)
LLSTSAKILMDRASRELAGAAAVRGGMTQSVFVEDRRSLGSVWFYYALACLLTWVLAFPATFAFLHGESPSALAVTGAGLSAFGPLLAALIVALRDGSVRTVFRIRTNAPWLRWTLLALLAPLILRAVAAGATALFGFELSRWFYLPTLPTQMAALIVFPLGEEFGWRGLAYPRLREHFGTVRASLIVGVMWSAWHLGYMVDTRTGEVAWIQQLESLVALPMYSVILSWFFERARGSVAVAIGFHAAAHLNHIELAPLSEVGFHALHLGVVAVAALVAGRSLARRDNAPDNGSGAAPV